MNTTQNRFTSISEVIGDKSNRQLDELIASGSKVENFSGSILNAARDCALITDHYLRENTWKAVGMGAVLGLILGLRLSRE